MKSKLDDPILMCFLRAKMYTVQQGHVRKAVKETYPSSPYQTKRLY